MLIKKKHEMFSRLRTKFHWGGGIAASSIHAFKAAITDSDIPHASKVVVGAAFLHYSHTIIYRALDGYDDKTAVLHF